jgi:glutamate dehydrogenase/leucine dehydrogenase
LKVICISFVVQGFDAVGYWGSKFIEKDGGKITTVCEYNSAIHNPDGLDVQDVKDYMVANGTLKGYPHATEENCDDPLSFMTKQADCLIPAATEKSVHKGNANDLQVRCVFEGANGPTTYAAE